MAERMTPVIFKLDIDELSSDAIKVVRLEGDECLTRPYRFDIDDFIQSGSGNRGVAGPDGHADNRTITTAGNETNVVSGSQVLWSGGTVSTFVGANMSASTLSGALTAKSNASVIGSVTASTAKIG